MSLGTAPAAARRLLPLALLLTVTAWFGMALAILGGVRAGIGADSLHLAGMAIPLALGLPMAGFIATETLAYLLGSRLLLPASLLIQVARDAARNDFRHVPPPGGADEAGRLADALGRLIRHLARRRRDLDLMAAEMAGQALVAGGAARAARLLAEQAPPARLVATEPDPAVAWLNPARHRLLCALASGLVVLSAAPLGAEGVAAVAAVALLAGRLVDRVRRFGGWAVWSVVAAALILWLLPATTGQMPWPPSLAVAAAASFALHFGSGWRGPCHGIGQHDGGADAAWHHAGLAGALAGGGVAAALIGILGAPLASALLPIPLLALGAAATMCAAGPAATGRAGWPGAPAALRLLRQAAVRRLIFIDVLPAGLMLGFALALSAPRPDLAVAVAVLASLVAGAQGAMPARRFGRWPSGLLFLAALGLLAGGLAAGAAALTAAAAILAWPVSPQSASTSPTGQATRQVILLVMLARTIGIGSGMLVAGAGLRLWLAHLVPGAG
jgi:HAMP domain-containing protein